MKDREKYFPENCEESVIYLGYICIFMQPFCRISPQQPNNRLRFNYCHITHSEQFVESECVAFSGQSHLHPGSEYVVSKFHCMYKVQVKL